MRMYTKINLKKANFLKKFELLYELCKSYIMKK